MYARPIFQNKDTKNRIKQISSQSFPSTYDLLTLTVEWLFSDACHDILLTFSSFLLVYLIFHNEKEACESVVSTGKCLNCFSLNVAVIHCLIRIL